MAKNYSYPRVTMSTYAKKHSHKVVNVPDTTIMFAPLVTEKGPDDRVVKIHTLSEFIETFGTFDEDFYKLNGQMALNVYNWLSNGGTLLVKRLCAEGDREASFVPPSESEIGYRADIIWGITPYKEYDLTGSDKLTLVYKGSDLSETEYENLTGKEFDVQTNTKYVVIFDFEKFMLEEIDSYVSVSTTTPTYKYLNQSAFSNLEVVSVYERTTNNGKTKFVPAEGVEISIQNKISDSRKYDIVINDVTFENIFEIEIDEIVKVENATITSKYKGAYYNNIYLEVTRVGKVNSGVYNFIVYQNDPATNKSVALEKFLQKTSKNYLAALSNSELISIKDISEVFTENAEKYTYELSNGISNIVGYASDEPTDATTLSCISKFWELETSDSSATSPETRYLVNRLETPIDIIFDAGYPLSIKKQLIDFTRNIEDENGLKGKRDDIVCILDIYELNKNLKLNAPENSGLATDHGFASEYPTNIALYEQYFTILDSTFTSQHVFVTPTYFLTKLFAYNDQTYGLQYPTAGLRRGILDDALFVNENPSPDQKENWFVQRINYVEKTSREYAFMSQRTFDGSTDLEYTALSFLNNERVLERMKKDLETLGRSYLHEFNDAVTIANMTTALNKYVNNWISNRTLSMGVVEVVQNEVSENALDINLNIRFTNTIEVINVSIVIE